MVAPYEGLLSFLNKNSEPVTPRMLLGPGPGGCVLGKMVEHMEKG